MIDPFVENIWLNPSFLMERSAVRLSVLACVLRGLGEPLAVVIGVSGLFEKERKLSILASATNLIVSLALVIPYGLCGVLAGTCLAYAIQIIYRGIVFFRDYVKKWKTLCSRFFQYLFLILTEVWITGMLIEIMGIRNITQFLVGVLICVVIPLTINILAFKNSSRGMKMTNMIIVYLKKERKE